MKTILFALLLGATAAIAAQAADTKLWYDKPAADNWMTEALPLEALRSLCDNAGQVQLFGAFLQVKG